MDRRSLLKSILGFPFLKWALPKVRPSKVEVYFEQVYPPKALDGEPVFTTNNGGNVIYSNGTSIDRGSWISIEAAMREWRKS